jgi:hypothetical protein
MKLNEIAKQPVDWNTKSEKAQIDFVRSYGENIGKIDNPSEAVQLAAVNNYGPAIAYIKNPSEGVQLAAISQQGYLIKYINNPTQTVLLTVLKDLRFINNQGIYEKAVRRLFANNTLLMKKWLRYGEAMREQS